MHVLSIGALSTLIENPSFLGVGGGLESVDTMEPMGMLDNMFAQQKPESVLGNLFLYY